MESRKKKIGIISWGPIESLSNGYFVRVYSMAEKFYYSTKNKIIVIEYAEQLTKPYQITILKLNKINNKYLVKISVPGNEKVLAQAFYKYLRFIIWQIINSFKLRSTISELDVIITGGELFILSALISKLINPNVVIIADPQMLLSEREERTGKKVTSFIYKILEKIYFRNSNYIIAISNNMKNKILHNFNINNRKVIVIPHMLPESLSKLVSCNNTNKLNDIINIAFIGALDARQNLDAAVFLVKTLYLVKLVGISNVRLMLIGRANEDIVKSLYEIAKRYSVEGNIEVYGYVNELDSVLCDADVLVAPMFTMSGVSTKMLYYLRFSDKVILASREAIEGLESLVKKHGNVIIAWSPRDFVFKLISVLKKLSRDSGNGY